MVLEAGEAWKSLPQEERVQYSHRAKVMADEQKKLYPDCWKRKRTATAAASSSSTSASSSTTVTTTAAASNNAPYAYGAFAPSSQSSALASAALASLTSGGGSPIALQPAPNPSPPNNAFVRPGGQPPSATVT